MVRVLIVLSAVLAIAFGSNIRWPAPRLDDRIVGGVDAYIEELPYQLSLQHFGRHICGASVISANWALTAAHCVRWSHASHISFRAGSSFRGSGGTVHKAERVVWHPYYDEWNIDFDYALVRVATPFPIGTSGVQVVKLTDSESAAGTASVVSGWGSLREGGGSSNQLQLVQVPIVVRAVCEELYRGYPITPRMICGGDANGGKDSCQGDSGGPMVSNGVQTGIVSWGIGCGRPNYVGVYSNVAAVRVWIKEVCGV